MFTLLLKWDSEIVQHIQLKNKVILIYDHYDQENNKLDFKRFIDYYKIPDFNNLTEIISLSAHLKEKYGSSIRVLSHTEFTQYAQAYMLSYFSKIFKNIDKQIIFRNKYFMKRHANTLNINTTQYTLISQKSSNLPLPIIIKPINGMGSENTYFFRNKKAITSHLKNSHYLSLAEKYIEGEEYHADALISGGKILALSLCRYLTCPLEAAKNSIDISLLQNFKSNKNLYLRIKKMIKKFVSESAIHTTLVHFEFFIDKNKKILFSELAARMGGGYIKLLTRNMFMNFNLKESYIKLSLGASTKNTNTLYPTSDYYYAGVNIRLAHNKIIKKVPSRLLIKSLKNVIDFEVVAKKGEPMGRWGIMLCLKSQSLPALQESISLAHKKIIRNFKF